MLGQFIFNQLINNSNAKGLVYKFWMLCRRLILSIHDPIVTFKYDQFNLAILLSHDLPFNMQQYPTYNKNLGLLCGGLNQKYPQLKVIDVGANIGDSVAVIHEVCKVPVLCIEGNPKFIPILNNNLKQFKNCVAETCYVGEEEVMVNAVNNLGTAYLRTANDGIMVKRMQTVLAQHKSFENAKLLKIDTDGFDTKIIRASKEFLLASKAAIFFEYDPYFLSLQNENGLNIFPWLANLNYTTLLMFDNTGRLLCTANINETGLLEDLNKYFNRNGSAYMDILVLHQEDEDLLISLKKLF